jgi:hypothetical protein
MFNAITFFKAVLHAFDYLFRCESHYNEYYYFLLNFLVRHKTTHFPYK